MGWNRPLNVYRRIFLSILMILVLAGAGAKRASAQAVYAIIENQYVRAKVGVSGQENSQDVAGRLVVEDPNVPGTTLLLGPVIDLIGVNTGVAVPGSFVTVRIDGGPSGNLNQPGWDLIFGATGVGGKTDQSLWIFPPTVVNGHILARWATRPGGDPAKIPPIQVDLDVTLVHDMACYKFTVHNGIIDTIPPTIGSQQHSVGLRFAEHYAIRTPTTFESQGPVFLSDGRQICTETDLVGTAVPNSWRLFDQARVQTSGATLRPTTTTTFIQPDRLVFAAATIMSTLWDFVPTTIPNFNFCVQDFDAAAALYWNPRGFQPGEQQDFVTYYGKQRSTIDFTPPWAAGVDGPLVLQFDSSKPVGQQLTPNPFTVNAFVKNSSAITLTNVTAVINLPTGLALATGDPNNTATKTQGTLVPDGEAQFNWKVVPTGAASGRTTYSVSFTAGPGGQGRSVTRDIDIPALPFQTFAGTLQMVSFPFTFDDPTTSVALGLTNLQFDLLRWNPVSQIYEVVPSIRPGEGYWLRLANQTTINLKGAHQVNTTSANFEIRLTQGWNQIGNPFLRQTAWANVQVVNTDATDPKFLVPIPVDQAAQAGWIAPVLYRYDVNDKQYKFDADFTGQLVPYVGYWVKSLQPNIFLLIPPPDQGRAAPISRSASTPAFGGPDSWKLRIVASAGTAGGGSNVIGVSSGALDGYDRNDIEQPPAIQNGIGLGIARKDWGTRAGLYMQDIQAANGGRKQWNVVVTSPQPNTDVTLSWPDIGTLPRTHELYITDTASGTRRAMRQTSSLRINTGQMGSRSLVITAEPRNRSAFRISGLSVTPSRSGGSATIAFTTTQDANVSVRVLGASGQPIRTLMTRAASSGQNLLTWDYRDGRGTQVAAGAYLIEVKGTTPDGTSSRQIVNHLVTR